MKDSIRESLSYWGLYRKIFQVKKVIKPQAVSFGNGRQQYFLYYEPEHIASDKVIIWVHGVGGPYRFSGKQQHSHAADTEQARRLDLLFLRGGFLPQSAGPRK